MKSFITSVGTLLATAALAAADPSVTVTPASIHPGEPVLVTVTDATAPPHGKGGGRALVFYRAKHGYQAVFAAPLAIDEDHVLVEVTGAAPVTVPVANKKFPETKLVVEEEYANPPKEDRDRIDADNRAIVKSYAKANGAPQFTRPFVRPRGAITSTFGEWRTFNDGHRAQHLGIDLAAHEGAKVAAINDGTVVFVGETFLAGNVVVIAHGAGISSLYFHLSRPTVAEGDAVTQGQEIGRAGHTGRTTGPHLHLSIHVESGMVDPIAFLKLPLEPATSPGA
jgi:murein DD-endopeptidase MepM/ murein hydrolase activator NlpD